MDVAWKKMVVMVKRTVRSRADLVACAIIRGKYGQMEMEAESRESGAHDMAVGGCDWQAVKKKRTKYLNAVWETSKMIQRRAMKLMILKVTLMPGSSQTQDAITLKAYFRHIIRHFKENAVAYRQHEVEAQVVQQACECVLRFTKHQHRTSLVFFFPVRTRAKTASFVCLAAA